MRRILLAATICLGALAPFVPAHAGEGGFALTSHTGNLLRGTVYKYSGAGRTGVITIRMRSRMPGETPTFRYDFDVVHGKIEKNLYSYMAGDIAEMQFLPIEDGVQPVNNILRNGVAQRIVLTSADKAIIGPVFLNLIEAVVETDGYGENVITGGDVYRIVFDAPDKIRDKEMSSLVDEFGKALLVGRRDGLVDKEFLSVLENMQKLMKARVEDGKKE